MTLTELFDTLSQRDAIPNTRVKDLKTSLRYLAQALQASPETLTEAETLEPRYKTAVEHYFTEMTEPPSHHTVRNTLNNLSFFFRAARGENLLQGFIPQPQRHPYTAAWAKAVNLASPYRRHAKENEFRSYWIPVQQWPLDIREGWLRYCAARQFEVRVQTLKIYEEWIRRYVSYRVTFDSAPMSTWDHVFDPEALRRFVSWHVKRFNVPRITISTKDSVRIVLILAKHDARPELLQLKAFQHKLPNPEPMHDKQSTAHSLTLPELDQVGLTLINEAHRPLLNRKAKHPGTTRAGLYGKGLILRLLVRVPLRQRNIRDMLIGRNLYQDSQGTWQIRFQGEELKIGHVNGRTNIFHVPFPPELVEQLEEYRQHYRPLLPHSEESQHIFINWLGHHYSPSVLRYTLFYQIYSRTGKRFYPHLIRTIWTDTFLLKTHDISTAAYMLNDRPETVLKRYHELRGNDHIQKAYQFNTSLLGS